METTFYNSNTGELWVATYTPPNIEGGLSGEEQLLENYPEGTIIIPAQPSENHTFDGESWVYVEPEQPDFEILKKQYEVAVQAHIDAMAFAQGYDTIYTAISYIGSANAKWNAEGIALRDWRDSVWLATHGILNDVVGEVRPLPTIEQAIAELPVYEQPEV